MAGPTPTRQRLIDEGLRLFARQGFDATSVGEIEAAAALQPRRGALYKHFPSKQALLEAALRAYVDRAATGAAQLDALEPGALVEADRELLRTLVAGFGRWFLDEMDRLEDITRVLEHDGARLAEITAEVKANLVDLSYRSAAAVITAAAPEADDPEAIAVIILGTLVALRRTAWTFGSPPLGIDDDRALATWADVTLAAFDALRDRGNPGR
jgi:AcrR family transcriptional regulator